MVLSPKQFITFTARGKTQILFPGWSLSGFALQHWFLLCLALIKTPLVSGVGFFFQEKILMCYNVLSFFFPRSSTAQAL